LRIISNRVVVLHRKLFGGGDAKELSLRGVIMCCNSDSSLIELACTIVTPLVSMVGIIVMSIYSKRDQKIDLIPNRVKMIVFVQAFYNVLREAGRNLDIDQNCKRSGISLAKNFIVKSFENRTIRDVLNREGIRVENKDEKEYQILITNVVYCELDLLKYYFFNTEIELLPAQVKKFLDNVVALCPDKGVFMGSIDNSENNIIEAHESLLSILPNVIKKMEEEAHLKG
jgi:hypothetical protein